MVDDNNDGHVVPLDVLVVIDHINSHLRDVELPTFDQGPPPFLDVSGDDIITPLDALIVINKLNSGSSGEGEATGFARRVGWDNSLPLWPALSGSTVYQLSTNDRQRDAGGPDDVVDTLQLPAFDDLHSSDRWHSLAAHTIANPTDFSRSVENTGLILSNSDEINDLIDNLGESPFKE